MRRRTVASHLRRVVVLAALIYGVFWAYDALRQDRCLERGAVWDAEAKLCECTEVGGIWHEDQTCHQVSYGN